MRFETLSRLLAVALLATVAWAVAASPEDEIARLDRVRQTLFEDLVRTRGEVAARDREINRLDRVRQSQFEDLVRSRGEVAARDREIMRLDRVRQSLFEDLVKARAEAAAARRELELAKAKTEASRAAVAAQAGSPEDTTASLPQEAAAASPSASPGHARSEGPVEAIAAPSDAQNQTGRVATPPRRTTPAKVTQVRRAPARSVLPGALRLEAAR